MSKTKHILLAAMYVGVTLLLLGYSAYAWIAMSRQITATGNNINVTMADGLEISQKETSGYDLSTQINFSELIEQTLSGEDKLKFESLNKKFFLLPASSDKGISIWQTEHAYSGNLINLNDFAPGHSVSYNSSNSAFEGHYIDIPLWIRNIGNSPVNLHLNSKASSITVSGDEDSIIGTVRIAFLNQQKTAVLGDNDMLVYALGADTSSVVVDGDGEGAVPVLSPILPFMEFDNDTFLSTTALCELQATEYSENIQYHPMPITVRIWIEGQDRNCIATKFNGNKTFTINLGFAAQ